VVVTRGGSPYGGVRGRAPGMGRREEHLIRINGMCPASAPESKFAGYGPSGARHWGLSPVSSRQSVRKL
jgi:hypothetical protein